MRSRDVVKARALRAGDAIGIVSPAWFGGEAFIPRAQAGIRHLESLGFRVIVGEHAFNNRDHVSDTAQHRAGRGPINGWDPSPPTCGICALQVRQP